MKYKVLKFYFVIFFCLSSILFFLPIFIPLSFLYYTYYALFLITFLLVIINYKSSDNNVFTIPIFLLLIAILISGFSATFSWGQGLINSFKALTFYLSYILFFLLLNWKIRVQDIEKIIIIFGITYLIIYSVAFFLYPVPIFSNVLGFSDDRGFQRIVVNGFGFLFLFSFYSWSQYLKKRQFLWLIIFLITVIYIIMLLTRTLIMGSFIFLMLYMLRVSSFFKKIVAIILVGCFVYFVTQMNFFQLLVEQTKVETKNVEDNIRVQSARYYLNDFSPNTFTRIFGNGESSEGSSYSRYKYNLEEELRFFQSDLGYIGLYSKFGLLAILAYLILIYRTVNVSVPDDYLYCKYYLYFVFLISIIIDATFDTSFISTIVLATYVLHSKDLSRTDNKESSG